MSKCIRRESDVTPPCAEQCQGCSFMESHALVLRSESYVPDEDISEACQIMRQVFNDVRLVDLQFDNLYRRMQTFIDKHPGISP